MSEKHKRGEGVAVHGTVDVPVFRDGRLQDPSEDRIAALEEGLAEQRSIIEAQAQALALERSKREALEEATAPLLERSQEPEPGEKGEGDATRR